MTSTDQSAAQPSLSFRDVLPESLNALARGGIAASQAKLPVPLRALHRYLLQLFLFTGTPPRVAELTETASVLGLDLDSAVVALADADLVHVDAETGHLAVAYPLSGRPSPHSVQLDGLPPVTAMCAIDALGVPLMAAASGVISSSDPTTGEPIQVSRLAGTWRWSPDSTVVVLSADPGCSGPIANACTSTAFHANYDLASAYLDARPGSTGRVLDRAEAISVATTEFGGLLLER